MTKPDENEVLDETRRLTDRMLATVAVLEKFTAQLAEQTRRQEQEEVPGD